MARARVLKSFTLKFQQSNKCLWGNKRVRTRKNSTSESQDLDQKGSPHKEEKVIGRVVDLDLLSLFPKFGQKSWRDEEEASSQKCQQWRRESAKGQGTIGEEDPLNRSTKYPTVVPTNVPGRYYRTLYRYYRILTDFYSTGCLFRQQGRYYQLYKKLSKHRYRNDRIFCFRTPFSTTFAQHHHRITSKIKTRQNTNTCHT